MQRIKHFLLKYPQLLATFLFIVVFVVAFKYRSAYSPAPVPPYASSSPSEAEAVATIADAQPTAESPLPASAATDANDANADQTQPIVEERVPTNDAIFENAPLTTKQSFATSFALLVGVNVYQDDQVFPTLNYASSDATALRNALVEIGFNPKNIRLLTSDSVEEPTKANIDKALEELLTQAVQYPDATLLVSFAGHGLEPLQTTVDALGKESEKRVSIFFPSDANLSDQKTFIRINTVAQTLRRVKKGFKIMIVDACRNFNISDEESAPNASARGALQELQKLERNRAESAVDPFESQGDGDSGVAFLQSCSPGQKSYESETLNQGYFSYYFIEGLKNATRDGVTLFSVCDHASQETDKATNSSQTPYLSYSGPRFWLVPPIGARGSELLWGLVKEPNVEKSIDEKRAFEFLSRLRKSDNFEARAELAALYLRGCASPGGQVDAKQAFELATETLNHRDLPAAWETLGDCRAGALGGVERDLDLANDCYRKAYQGWQKRAQAGDIVATFKQGVALLEGKGVKRDRAAGVRLLQKAANANLPASMTRLAEAYLLGHGVAKDEKKAVENLLRAYERGDYDASSLLGDCYLNGWGVKENASIAFEYYREAFEANRPQAANALADLYELGHGVAIDPNKALILRRQAAEQNNPTAQKIWGDYNSQGLHGVTLDAAEGVRWYERAAAQNNVDAMLSLAECLRYGLGVNRDEKRASELTAEAARLTVLENVDATPSNVKPSDSGR